jgi:hypothetical protein
LKPKMIVRKAIMADLVSKSMKHLSETCSQRF